MDDVVRLRPSRLGPDLAVRHPARAQAEGRSAGNIVDGVIADEEDLVRGALHGAQGALKHGGMGLLKAVLPCDEDVP